MNNETISLANTEEYERQRAEIMSRYTPQLKAMSAGDPMRATVWNARADALRDLAERFAMPAEEQR